MTATYRKFEGTTLSSRALPYMAPPYTYEGNQVLYIEFQTTPETLQSLIPQPLIPNQDSVMTLYVGELKVEKPMAVSYHEVALLAPVSYGNTTGVYFINLYLDTSMGIVIGREIWGFSKFDANISLTEKDNKIHALVERHGIPLITVSWGQEEKVEPTPGCFSFPIYNLKLVPSVQKDAPFDVMQLTATVLSDYVVTEQYRGTASLIFGTSPVDPLGDIPIQRILSSTYRREGFVLGHGKVLYDYLSH